MAVSPIKKINFESVGKENVADNAVPAIKAFDMELKKPVVEVVKKEEKAGLPTGMRFQEAEEPLLQENPNRFVLFPIKYHEVRVDASHVY